MRAVIVSTTSPASLPPPPVFLHLSPSWFALGSPLVDDALGSPLVDDALGSPLVDDAASVAGPEETRAVTSQVRPHERYMQKRRAQLSASQRSEESG